MTAIRPQSNRDPGAGRPPRITIFSIQNQATRDEHGSEGNRKNLQARP